MTLDEYSSDLESQFRALPEPADQSQQKVYDALRDAIAVHAGNDGGAYVEADDWGGVVRNKSKLGRAMSETMAAYQTADYSSVRTLTALETVAMASEYWCDLNSELVPADVRNPGELEARANQARAFREKVHGTLDEHQKIERAILGDLESQFRALPRPQDSSQKKVFDALDDAIEVARDPTRMSVDYGGSDGNLYTGRSYEDAVDLPTAIARTIETYKSADYSGVKALSALHVVAKASEWTRRNSYHDQKYDYDTGQRDEKPSSQWVDAAEAFREKVEETKLQYEQHAIAQAAATAIYEEARPTGPRMR